MPEAAAARGMYRRSWRVGHLGRDWLAIRAADLVAGEKPLDPFLAAPLVAPWLAGHTADPALAEMYQAAFGRSLAAAKNRRDAVAELERAFRERRLVLVGESLFRRTEPGAIDHPETESSSKPAASQPPKQEKPKPEKTWFRCQLFQEDGTPAKNEPYKLKDSNGAMREGKLDENGCVYIPPILNPGDCTISFPKMHLNPRKKK